MLNLEPLLDRLDLIDLAEQAGATFRSPNGKDQRSTCPLHQGDNPTAFSIHVDQGRQYYRCYTNTDCGSGDAIEFIARWKSLEFGDAVRWAADYAGLTQEAVGFDSGLSSQHSTEGKLLHLAADFFQKNLWLEEGQPGLAYARARGFTDETIRAHFGFTLGYGLQTFFEQQQPDDSLVYEIGLLRKDGLDFTANANGRAVSPAGWLVYIHRHRGRVTYLSARAVQPVDPKDKARNLPGPRQLYWALSNSKAHKGLIVVEGPACAESLRQIGFNAVALCGLGQPDEHDLKRLQRSQPLYLALDHDRAGEQRRHALALQLGPLTKVVPELPNGCEDFNAWLQAGMTTKEASRYLDKSEAYIDTWLAHIKALPLHAREAALTDLVQLIAHLPVTLRDSYIRQVDRSGLMTARTLREQICELPTSTASDAESSKFAIQDGCLTYSGDKLGNFWAKITSEQMLDDGDSPPTVRYVVAGGLATGEALPPIRLTADEFALGKWVQKYWGARCVLYLSPAQRWLFTRAVQEISLPELHREHVYAYTGWCTIDGQRAFLTSSGALTASGLNRSVKVDLNNLESGPNNLRYYALLEPPSDPATMLRASFDLLELGSPLATYPLWAAMYAAPLTSITPLNAVPWATGGSQVGKSTLAHLLLSHFGAEFIDGRNYHAPIDWLSTPTGLEVAAFQCKDLPLIIDDYCPKPTRAEAEAQRSSADRIIRSVGNRSARGRATIDLKLRKSFPPRGVVIATAEKGLTVKSIVGRTITIPFESQTLFGNTDYKKSVLDQAQQLAGQGVYAQAMSFFLQWLIRHWQEIEAQIRVDFEAASRSVREVLPGDQKRLPDYFAVLFVATQTALRCMQEAQAITEAEYTQRLEQFRTVLIDLLKQQAQQVAAHAPLRKIFEATEGLLQSRRIYFAPRTGNTNFPAPEHAQLVGYFDTEDGQRRLCLIGGGAPLLAAVGAYFAAVSEHLDLSIESFREEAANSGFLTVDREGKRTISLNTPTGKTRLLVLQAERIEAAFEVCLEPAVELR